MAEDAENQEALASFMTITGAESASALQYLELTNWQLDEAVNLFMESGGQSASTSAHAGSGPPPAPMDDANAAAIAAAYGDDDIRAPDPSKRQRLVGFEMGSAAPIRRLRDQYRDFAAESFAAINGNESAIAAAFGATNGIPGALAMGSDVSSAVGTTSDSRQRDLSTLFQPPLSIMFQGSYSDARTHAKSEGKWLLVNIQDEIVFASHMLNRDTWSDDVVQNLVASGFVFWQNYWASEHGKKFCSLYQIDRDTLPIVAIIDPRTNQIMQRWTGFLEPQDMTEKLSDFSCMNTMDTPMVPTTQARNELEPNIMDASEDDQLAAAIAASMQDNDGNEEEVKQEEDVADEEEEKAEEPVVPLSPEPAADAPDVTRVQIRVPDGSRLTRRFLKTDPLSMVWAFVKDQVPEARGRAFELRTTFPPRAVAYNETSSIAEGKLENASLMVKWL